MSTGTGIEWTDATWNPTAGCSLVSLGCTNCYAMKMAGRLEAMGQKKYAGLTKKVNGKTVWTGKMNLDDDALTAPLGWKKPRKVFVNSMSDLFHVGVPFDFIDKVFAVMALTPRHTYQVLTKRPERMAEYLNSEGVQSRIAKAIDGIEVSGQIEELAERWVPVPGYEHYQISNHGAVKNQRGMLLSFDVGDQGHCRVTLYHEGVQHKELVHRLVLTAFDRPAIDGEQGRHRNGDATCNALPNLLWGTQSENWQERKRHGNGRAYCKLNAQQVESIREQLACGHPAERLGREYNVSATQIRNIGRGDQWAMHGVIPWPLPGVWLGTSCENQATADERIPHLLRCPAAVRFLSCEPLLGAVDLNLSGWFSTDGGVTNQGIDELLHWVIVGGESGHGSRPLNVQWVRDLVGQCKAAGVSCFVKQLGANVRDRNDAGFEGDTPTSWPMDTGTEDSPNGHREEWQGAPVRIRLEDKKGADPSEWPEDLRVREFPAALEPLKA